MRIVAISARLNAPKIATVEALMVGHRPRFAATSKATEAISTARATSFSSLRSGLKRCETYKGCAAKAACQEMISKSPRMAFVTLIRSER